VSQSNSPIGHRIVRVETVGSTNSLALELAQQTAPHGTVVTAHEQTAGRGQYGRSWFGQSGESLLLSVLLRPAIEFRRPVILTAWAAVALGDAIYSLTGTQARIKWPNDLLIRGKKVSGILIEATNDAVVVGIGLNVNQSRETFESAGLPEATSLAIVASSRLDIQQVFNQVLSDMNREWDRLVSGERVPVEADWKWRIGLLGRPIAAECYDGTTVTGRLLDMSFDGIEVCRDSGVADILPPETIRHLRAL
jgi:BirA family biotin operon repressor/biotin-[acetyl-CoA-carboxylase] ligase